MRQVKSQKYIFLNENRFNLVNYKSIFQQVTLPPTNENSKLYNLLMKNSDQKLNLLLSGFSAQNIISTDEIVKIIKLLPTAHIHALDEINYDPYRVIPKVHPNCYHATHKSVKGCYIQNLRMIALFNFSNKLEAIHILLHEVGHHVYYQIISSVIKKQWVTQIHSKKQSVSEYSKTNASEDFAECYATYFISPEKLKLHKEKFNFFQDIIFT